jgi:hypothetical protein
MPLVTIIYVLANVAYLAVLTPYDMMTTKAIAVVSIHTLACFKRVRIDSTGVIIIFLSPLLLRCSAYKNNKG